MSGPSYSQATEFILCQQFYHRDNTVVDRTNDRRIVINSSSRVIDQVLETINSMIHTWEKDRERFLDSICDFLQIDYKRVIGEIYLKLEALAETSPDPMVEYMTATGVVFSVFRENTSETLVERINQDYPEARRFQETLKDRLVMDESLLANIAVMYKLAEIVNISLPPEYLPLEMAATAKRLAELPENEN